MQSAVTREFADFGRRPSVIDIYLLRLLVQPAISCLGITFAAMVLEGTLRLINELSENGAHLSFLFGLIGSLIPYYLGLALSLSFLISIMLVIARLDDGSEIDAMLASGRSLARLVVPFVFVGLVLSLISLVLLGFLQPYSRYGYRAVRVAAVNAGWTVTLQPEIIMSPGNGVTITADQADATGRVLDGVFVSRIAPDGSETVSTAQTGMLAPGEVQGSARLLLARGLVLQDAPEQQPRLFRFTNMQGVENTGGSFTVAPRGATDPRELTLGELVGELNAAQSIIPRRALAAELYTRLARAFGLLLMPLLAMPLALATKRGRRAPGLIIGTVVMMAFHHGLQLARGLAINGTAPPALTIGAIFFGFAALASWLFFSSVNRPGDTPLSRLIEGIQAFFAHNDDKTKKPKTRWPRSASLRLYVAQMLFVRTLGAWAALIGLLQMIDMLERMTELLDRGGLAAIVRYSVLRLPAMAQQTAGLAMLIGALITFMQFARNSEMVVMRSTGLSMFQIFKKTIPVAFLVAAIHFVVADQLTPRAELAFRNWWTTTDASEQSLRERREQPRWFRIGTDIVQAGGASQDGETLRHLRVYQRDTQNTLVRRINADSAQVQANGSWLLRDAVVTEVGGERAASSKVERFSWQTPLRPQDTTRLFSDVPQISSGSALGSLRGNAPARESRGFLTTRLYRALAEPMIAIAMLLLALPLTFAHPRSDLTRPVLYAILGGLLYLVADGLLTAMGQAGALPPFLAAWAAPLIFIFIATTVLFYTEA